MPSVSGKFTPRFDGPIVENQHIEAGLFIVKTVTQRNELKLLYRKLDTVTTTLCYVVAESTMYELINNPSSDSTSNSDWKKITLGTSAILTPKGNWDPNTNTPALSDATASSAEGHLYFVENVSSSTDFTITGLFSGETVSLVNRDWVVSVGTKWIVSKGASLDWNSLNVPQVILDYENGIIITHTHSISNITGLQTALDSKFDTSDVADHLTDIDLQTGDKLTDIEFLLVNFYKKSETYTKTEVDALIPDVSGYSTIASTDTKDAATLQSAKDYVDNNFDTSGEVDNKINSAVSLSSQGIIGEVADIAARNALNYGDVLPGGDLSTSDRVIATDVDGIRKVYQYSGTQVGHTGSAYWTFIYNYEVLTDTETLQKAITKAGHGFVVGDVITYKSGTYSKYVENDKPVGIVTKVIDTDNFKLVLSGYASGFSSLTTSSVYYVQSDGTIGTTETRIAIMIAISATEGIVLSSGSGDGAVKDIASYTHSVSGAYQVDFGRKKVFIITLSADITSLSFLASGIVDWEDVELIFIQNDSYSVTLATDPFGSGTLYTTSGGVEPDLALDPGSRTKWYISKRGTDYHIQSEQIK